MNEDDARIGRLIRMIRQQAGMTQVQLANAAKVPLTDVKLMEAGHATVIKLGRIRSIFEALDGRARLVPWWKGAAADRLLDERHAAIAERSARYFPKPPWETHMEVSFAEYGERGSIDILGANRVALAVAVCEVKSVIGSLEETNRMLDVKERLAPTVAFKRLGWRPRVVGRLLILPRDSTVQRVIAAHPITMGGLYPARAREIRAWLRDPSKPISGIWFVSDGPHGSSGQA
ncbi:MAG: helix-turn-helix transcriptional regulator [Chloroflexota bacterium]|nr:helix-turn-helix transcriptional regulator [Chloroflexota bacterium]